MLQNTIFFCYQDTFEFEHVFKSEHVFQSNMSSNNFY